MYSTRLVRLVGLLLAVLSSTVGCRSERKGEPQAKPAVTAPAGTSPLPMKLGPITVEEVRVLLPAAADFPAARTIKAPTKAEDERVGTFLCFDKGTRDDVFNNVRARLVALGWADIEVHDQVEDNTPKRVITARRLPFNLVGEVLRTSAPSPEPGPTECLEGKGQTLVSLLAFHLVPAQ